MKNTVIKSGRTSCNILALYLRDIRKIPFLLPDVERELAIKVFEIHDKFSAQRIVTAYLPLVVKIAKRFCKYEVKIMDLISEGNIGLIKAVFKFNPYAGYPLATYARWWITASMQEHIISVCTVVKVDSHTLKAKLFGNVQRLRNRIQSVSSALSNTPKSAEALTISSIQGEQEVLDHSQLSQNNAFMLSSTVSLSNWRNADSAHKDPSESLAHNLLIDHNAINPEALAIANDSAKCRMQYLKSALQKLTERERVILLSRHMHTPTISLATLAAKYQISVERVRQIEKSTIKKVKEYISIAAKTDGIEDL